MSPVIKGEARRHQLVTTYGVGSVVALGDESFMVAGIDYWQVDDPNIHEPRLERELRVEGFVDPPASGDERRPDIPVVRFPDMHSCPSCKRLAPHRDFTTFDGNKCGLCEELLVPVAVRGCLSQRPHRRLPVLPVGAFGADADRRAARAPP